jgi:hypothetical protein
MIVAGFAIAVVVLPANAAPKMSFGACKTKIMQDPRNLEGTGMASRIYCRQGCLGRVDGFDQDEAKCKSHERTVVERGFLAS